MSEALLSEDRSELGAFQDAFVEALASGPTAIAPWLATAQAGAAGLSVYRNTIAKGCVDALAANFPTVQTTVGEDWFRAAASRFAREAPPRRAALLDYGEAFPAWLERFPPAADLPYLPGIARLDRLWLESLFAAEAPPLAAEAFTRLAPEALAATRATPHPSLRFARFPLSLPALWIASRDPEPGELELGDRPQAVLIVRPAGAVAIRLIDDATHAFLAACTAGFSLGEAMGLAAEAPCDTDLTTLFAALIADGVFSGLIPGA